MRAITKFAAAAAVALTMGTVSAADAAIYISFDGVTTAATFADGTFIYSTTNIGGFETINVLGDTGAFPALFHSQQVDVNTNGGNANLSVYVTQTDIAGPMPQYGYFSSFTGNNSRDGITVTTSTFADASNGLFGGTLLSTTTFAPTQGSASLNDVYAAALPPSAGLFSVTHKYEFTDVGVGRGSTSPTITLAAAVPEPGTWALMIIGFGGAGAMLRSRRRSAALA